MECGEPRLDSPWHGQVAFSACQGRERKLPQPASSFEAVTVITRKDQ